MKMYSSVRFVGTDSVGAKSATCGAFSASRCSRCSARDIVAEKRSVWRREGSRCKMSVRSEEKPSSSNRSASSMIKKRVERMYAAVPGAKVVGQAAGRANHNMWPLGELQGLAHHVDAADNDSNAQLHPRAECGELIGDLRKLARRREHDRENAEWVLRQRLQHRQRECSRLARASLRALPRTSRPWSAGVMHAVWIGVGLRRPISAHVEPSQGERPRAVHSLLLDAIL